MLWVLYHNLVGGISHLDTCLQPSDCSICYIYNLIFHILCTLLQVESSRIYVKYAVRLHSIDSIPYHIEKVHGSSVGLSSVTNPNPRGETIPKPAQANPAKAEPLTCRCLALRTRVVSHGNSPSRSWTWAACVYWVYIHLMVNQSVVCVCVPIFQAVRSSIYGRPGPTYIEIPGNMVTDAVPEESIMWVSKVSIKF